MEYHREPLGRLSRFLRVVAPGALALCLACAGAAPRAAVAGPGTEGMSAEEQATIQQDVERIRAATKAFRSLDAAVAAGYQRDVEQCVDNPPQGAMGYHHVNPSLLDDRIELEHPEILVYERMPGGRTA